MFPLYPRHVLVVFLLFVKFEQNVFFFLRWSITFSGEFHTFHIARIQEKVLDSNIRILLPEQNDFRVKKAIEFMRKSGYNLIDINEFNENQLYKDHIRKKKFTYKLAYEETYNIFLSTKKLL